MGDGFRRHRAARFEHVLDEVNAATRAVELVAQQHVGRTGRGAEAAMHAGAQDLFRLLRVGIEQLRRGEVGAHAYTPSTMRPGLRTWRGSNPSLTRRDKAASGPGCGSNT